MDAVYTSKSNQHIRKQSAKEGSEFAALQKVWMFTLIRSITVYLGKSNSNLE